MSFKFTAVIVTYNPDSNRFKSVLDSLVCQVDNVIIVDNGSTILDLGIFEQNKKIELITLNNNKGIAYATNIGIKKSIEIESDFVLLSDQDTVYDKNYIQRASSKIIRDSAVIAYSPNVYDSITKQIKPVYVLKRNIIKKIFPIKDCFVFQTIASGLIIDLSLYTKVGSMNEELFIDYVDFEWCWKANYYGFKILHMNELLINHELGNENTQLFGKSISKRNPIRYYYIIRNSLNLSLNCKYIKFPTRCQMFIKSFMYFFGYYMITERKDKKYLWKGLRDGFSNKLGMIS